jgi:cytochrome c biogenesis protein CcdA
LIGPVLVLVGMFFLDLLPVGWSKPTVSETMRRRIDVLGVWAALPLGIFFAVAFCPVSAACFFISLFRLLARYDSRFLLPLVYGLGAALPVIAFSFLIAFAAQAMGKAFHVLSQTVWWAQRAAGAVCLGVGVYYCVKYIFAW